MSFEGYYRILCDNGHLDEVDVYDCYGRVDDWKCWACGAIEAWRELVDETNGADDRYIFPLTILEESQVLPGVFDENPIATPRVYQVPNPADYVYDLRSEEVGEILKEWFEKKHPHLRVQYLQGLQEIVAKVRAYPRRTKNTDPKAPEDNNE